MSETFFLPQELFHAMQSHCKKQFPQEACGLLAGKGKLFQSWFPIKNILESPVRYRMDAQEQLNAFLSIEQNQQDLLGIVHSHPTGPSFPSETDLKEAYYPEAIYFIFYLKEEQWHFNAFRIIDHQVSMVEIQLVK